MIESGEVKIKIPEKFTSEYFETELEKRGYDVLRWAITASDGEYFNVSIAYIK